MHTMIYFRNPKDSVSMITMNGKLYIHWRFIPSCHFMLQNLSWGYKTSKTILMRFHPSQGPLKKQPHLQPLTLVFAKLWRRSKPELSRPQVEGCQWVGWWNLPDLNLHSSATKNGCWNGKRETPPPFCEGFSYNLPWIIEKPTIPPVNISIDQETEHTSHSQATSTRTHATEGFRP